MSEKHTESDEMYLANIASLQEAGIQGAVPLSSLAAALNVQPVSANQKVHELAQAGLVEYTPYRGVELTEDGRLAALNILRRRRLWEVFLVERLKFTPAEAEALACRLEHTLPPEAAERLAAYLGQPVAAPGGLPIPLPGDDEIRFEAALPLSLARPGERRRVVEIRLESAARGFLDSQQVRPGACLHVLAAAGAGEMLVQTGSGAVIALARELAEAVLAAPCPETTE